MGGGYVIEATFCFILISQVIMKIRNIKIQRVSNNAEMEPALFPGNASSKNHVCYLSGVGVGQWDEVRARIPNKRRG